MLAVADIALPFNDDDDPTAASWCRTGDVSSTGDDLPPDDVALLPNVSFHFDCFFKIVAGACTGTGAAIRLVDAVAGRGGTLSRGLSTAPDVRDVRLISRASC